MREIAAHESNSTHEQMPFDLLREGQDTRGESAEVRSRIPAHREESQTHFFHDAATLSQPEKDVPSPSNRCETDQEEKRTFIVVKPQLHHEAPLKSAILAELGKQLSYDHLLTAQGQSFLSTNFGSQWLASEHGRAYLSDHAHELLKTEAGQQWYQEKGSDWLASEHGRAYLSDHAHDFLKTEAGQQWYQEKGLDWLASEHGRAYLSDHADDFLKTEAGQQWLKSDHGRVFLAQERRRAEFKAAKEAYDYSRWLYTHFPSLFG
jgi:hypothetical protein